MAKLTIASRDRLPMLNALYSLGVTEEVIYQDLDSLCRRITREQLTLAGKYKP